MSGGRSVSSKAKKSRNALASDRRPKESRPHWIDQLTPRSRPRMESYLLAMARNSRASGRLLAMARNFGCGQAYLRYGTQLGRGNLFCGLSRVSVRIIGCGPLGCGPRGTLRHNVGRALLDCVPECGPHWRRSLANHSSGILEAVNLTSGSEYHWMLVLKIALRTQRTCPSKPSG